MSSMSAHISGTAAPVRGKAYHWATAVLVPLVILSTALGGPARAAGTGATPRAILMARAYPPPPMMAAAAALLDADTGRWLYLYHADDRRPMASTTKIMTALLAVEYGHLDDLYTVSHAAATIGETTMGLREGERVSLRDLLYGLMLPSGNDAAITIAEGLAGTQDAFAHIMNAKARDLGMWNTHFVTPHGLDRAGHYSSARDMALLTRAALRWPMIRQVVATNHIVIPATATHGTYDLTNINYFITWYPGADGVKPGYTGNAGLCQVESVHRYGRHLIGTVLATPNLYTDIRDLFNYGFGDFQWIQSRYVLADTPSQMIPAGTAAQPAAYFPATGHIVRAGFLSFFRTHGGLTTLGYPLTEEFIENGQTVQYFSRARLVFDPRTQASLPTPLGLLSIPNRTMLRPLNPPPPASWRIYFPQTGHSVTWSFRDFFQAYGGVATFGYPITEKVMVGHQLVQYFNNAEFIWHPTHGGGYVTVATLGTRLLDRLAPLPLATAPHPGGQTGRPYHPAPGAGRPQGRVVGPPRGPTQRPTPSPLPLVPEPARTPTIGAAHPPATPSITPTTVPATPLATATARVEGLQPSPTPASGASAAQTPGTALPTATFTTTATPGTAAPPPPTPTLEPQR